jgi:hypothetical protein
MSRFSGPQRGYKGLHGRTKGVMLAYRELKREEAESRARTYKQARANGGSETAGTEVPEMA